MKFCPSALESREEKAEEQNLIDLDGRRRKRNYKTKEK
jgi:hypothetical protein